MSSSERLRAVVARLRAECPWDRAQTLRSMSPFVVEEAYEVVEAMDRGERDALREELGDLLFQIHLIAAIAELPMDAVEDGIREKMEARHPHLFGTAEHAPDWESLKGADRSRVDGLPRSLPALVRAHRVAERVAGVGFDWPDAQGVLDKIDEERVELAEAVAQGDADAIAHEYGDVLLATTNLGRFLGIAAEDALRLANARFEHRFRGVEARARAAGVPLAEAGQTQLEAWWQLAKRDP